MSQQFNILHITTDFVTDSMQTVYTDQLKYEMIYQENLHKLTGIRHCRDIFCMCVSLSHTYVHTDIELDSRGHSPPSPLPPLSYTRRHSVKMFWIHDQYIPTYVKNWQFTDVPKR